MSEARYRAYFCRLGILSVTLLALGWPAQAADTTAVGGSKGSEVSFNLSCGADRVLSAVQVNFSSSRVGKVRGICTQVNEDGDWVGTTSKTDWSPTNVTGSYKNDKQLSCDSGYAVSGFRGRWQEYDTAFSVNALQVYCRKLGAGGTTSGSGQASGWAGGAGIQTNEQRCPSNQPARALKGRSKTYLNQFYLGCGTPTLVGGPRIELSAKPTPTQSSLLQVMYDRWSVPLRFLEFDDLPFEWDWIQEYPDGTKYETNVSCSNRTCSTVSVLDYDRGRSVKIYGRKGGQETNKISVNLPRKPVELKEEYTKYGPKPGRGDSKVIIVPGSGSLSWPDVKPCESYYTFTSAAIYASQPLLPPYSGEGTTYGAQVVKFPNVGSTISDSNTVTVRWFHTGQGMYYKLRIMANGKVADCPDKRR